MTSTNSCPRVPLINNKTVITRAEYERKRNSQNPDKPPTDTEYLMSLGVPPLIASLAERDDGHSLPSDAPRWAWLAARTPDDCAALAARWLLAMRPARKGVYISARELVETWTSSAQFGPDNRIARIAPLRAVPALAVAGVANTGSRYEAETLLAIVEHRRLAMLPTCLTSTLNGRGARAALMSAHCPAEIVDELIACISAGLAIDRAPERDQSEPR